MKYDLEVEIEAKRPVVGLNARIDEQVMREFRYAVKNSGVTITHVLTQLLKEFANEYRTRGMPKQKALF